VKIDGKGVEVVQTWIGPDGTSTDQRMRLALLDD
jgi:hypothetical protein